MNDIIDFINTNRDRYVDELKAYLAIPSISALPQHAADVRRCAEWTADEMRRVGLDTVPDPVTLDDLRDSVRAYFDRLAGYSALELAAVASPVGDEVRHATMAHRLRRLSRFADAVQPPLPKADRDRLTRLLAVLTTSASLRMWRDHLGASEEQAADDIVWVMRASIASSRTPRTGWCRRLRRRSPTMPA